MITIHASPGFYDNDGTVPFRREGDKVTSSSTVFLPRCATSALLQAVMAGAALLPQVDIADAGPGGPFSKFLGNWRGSGQIVNVNGGSEKIVCRATYSAGENSDELAQTLVCASDAFRIEVHSYIIAHGREATGNWTETTRQISGSLSGHLAGGAFDGSLTGPSFAAELSLRTSARQQVVNIRPQGSDTIEVNVSLSRSSNF